MIRSNIRRLIRITLPWPDFIDIDKFHHYFRLKMCAKLEARKWIKWQTGMRYSSYSHKEKAAKVKCPTHHCRITQKHILDCTTFTKAFEVNGYSAEHTKSLLTD